MGVDYRTKLQYPDIDQESVENLPEREQKKARLYLDLLTNLSKEPLILSIPPEKIEQIMVIKYELDYGRFINLNSNKSLENDLPTITLRLFYSAFDGDIYEMSQLISNEVYREKLLICYNMTSILPENKRLEGTIQLFVNNIRQIRQEKEQFDLEQTELREHEQPMGLDDFL